MWPLDIHLPKPGARPACSSARGHRRKVRTTSLSRRKSYCLKCSKPNPGPPVVSISTIRDRPMPSGLSHAKMLLAGSFWADAFGAGALAAEEAGAGVVWARRVSAAAGSAAGGRDGVVAAVTAASEPVAWAI